MKFYSLPWVLIAAMFGFCAWVRFALVEPAEVAFFCDSGVRTFECAIRATAIKVFTNGYGYLVLVPALLAVVTASGWLGWLAAWIGAAGLVLYNWDYAAVAFLIGVLTLTRAQFEHGRYEYRSRQNQT